MSSRNTDTRQKILNAALALLEAGDLSKVRMSDIAKRTGISRQAVYLHYSSRADLLIAATKYLDQLKEMDERLAPSRAATTGKARLDAWIEAWADYIPEIYGISKAFFAIMDKDTEAAAAWAQRMQDMREGCDAAIQALDRDGELADGLTSKEATDMLWTMLSVRSWELLTQDCGWPHSEYKARTMEAARKLFVRGTG